MSGMALRQGAPPPRTAAAPLTAREEDLIRTAFNDADEDGSGEVTFFHRILKFHVRRLAHALRLPLPLLLPLLLLVLTLSPLLLITAGHGRG